MTHEIAYNGLPCITGALEWTIRLMRSRRWIFTQSVTWQQYIRIWACTRGNLRYGHSHEAKLSHYSRYFSIRDGQDARNVSHNGQKWTQERTMQDATRPPEQYVMIGQDRTEQGKGQYDRQINRGREGIKGVQKRFLRLSFLFAADPAPFCQPPSSPFPPQPRQLFPGTGRQTRRKTGR